MSYVLHVLQTTKPPYLSHDHNITTYIRLDSSICLRLSINKCDETQEKVDKWNLVYCVQGYIVYKLITMKTTRYVRLYSLYIVCRLLFAYRIIKFVHYL